MPRSYRILVCFFVLAMPFLISSCAPVVGLLKKSDSPTVNVAILKKSAFVSISGDKLLIDIDGMRVRPRPDTTQIFEAIDGALNFNERLYHPKKLSIYGNNIKLNDRPYRGGLSIILDDGLLTVINSLALEDYLFGLINHEISSKWPLDAVKAQAVAARTYAYFKLSSNKDRLYHLESSVSDQVYGGSIFEDERARRAVNETKGEMLYYGNELARTFYHSSCGGETESAQNVWGKDFPYLKSVDDEFCSDAPNYFWSYETGFDSILTALEGSGYRFNERQEIDILGRSESGRAVSINVAGETLSGTKFRQLIGYGAIKSTLFKIEVRGSTVIFSGSGSGHGVGMCQWGAKGMAEAGGSYRQILNHYYPETVLKKIY